MPFNYRLKPEELEARKLKEYLDILVNQGRVQVYTHINNETYTTSWRQKHRNKAVGVKSGVPDYLIITKNHAVFIELKRNEGGQVSATQKVWIQALPGKTTQASVCKGFEQAKLFLDSFL
jgi:hypothetical protein